MTGQTWDPELYAKHASFVPELGQAVLDLLAPRHGERILDLGCGDGALTWKLKQAGCDVLGVDSSEAQVGAARACGVEARVMDGEALAFGPELDAVFTNAALHWMKDADAVIAGAFRALRPGGRFVGECGGRGCVETLHRALIEALDARGHDGAAASPWHFFDDADYARRLAAAGFQVRSIALFPRPTPLPGDVLGWLETFARSFTDVLPPEQRQAYLLEVRDRVRPALQGAGGAWTADYVRLRFQAWKPSP